MIRPALMAASVALIITPALAQQNGPGYFIPQGGGGGGGGGGGAAPQQSRPAQRPTAPRPQAPALVPPQQPTNPPQAEAEPPPGPPVTLPPAPDLPTLARGATPPAAVIGVLGIPDIMRASTAAQQIEKVIGERREKLNEDAQKEQGAWRELQQQLASQRASLSADQIRARERELQERITNAQKSFRDRNRIIQESAQYGLAQIERMLVSVIRQVSESRGMNLVLHRQQVALNVNEFDITGQVVEQLNKVQGTVILPPDGVAPSAFTPPGATPAAATPAPATPAPAPAAPAAAPRR